jgi:sarcosine oxidase subunit beta
VGNQFDVVIIGAGALGAAIAYELAKLGYRTVNVDRLGGAGQGSTGDSASIVRVYSSMRQTVALAAEAVRYWRTWPEYLGVDDELGHARYIRTGSCVIKSPEGAHRRIVPHLQALGIRFEDWDAATLREHVPVFDVRSFWPPRPIDDERFFEEPQAELDGAIYVEEAGYVNDPALVAQNLQAAAVASGATFLFRAEVTEVRRSGGRVSGVTLADGSRLDAPVVVNVAGPHSARVNRLADVEQGMGIRTRALRHELHVVPSPAGFDYEARGLLVSDGDLAINFRPDAGNNILVGTEDPPCDPVTWVDEPDDYNRQPTQAQWERQVYRLARRIPSLGIPNEAKGLAGLYDVSDDWLPIYDRSDLPGFYMAVGTSGTQFKFAPVVGQLMADLIDACEQGHDHDAAPLQIRLRQSGDIVDMGAFSRRRTLNPDGSFI